MTCGPRRFPHARRPRRAAFASARSLRIGRAVKQCVTVRAKRACDLLADGIKPKACMSGFKEQYWRYSLFVIILALGVVIVVELRPYIGGILGAAAIYVLLRRQMRYLTACRKWRRSLAASILLVEAVICFLIPFSLVVWMFVSRIQDMTLDPQSSMESVRGLAEHIREKIHYDLLREENIASVVAAVTRMGHAFLQGVFSFGVNVVMLLFVLYFMLIGGTGMEQYCRALLPFNASVSRNVMREIYMIVRSNAIGIPLIAIVQGSIAYVGYVVCGVPAALFWAVVTCFATILPIVGAALVWVPAACILALENHWGAALGLFIYGTVVITQSDNVIRLVLQKKMADTHPVVTVLGVVIGLPLLGFMGVIFGPLILAMFVFFVHIFKRKYLDGVPSARLFDD